MKFHKVIALVVSVCVMHQTVHSAQKRADLIAQLRKEKAAERAAAAAAGGIPGPIAIPALPAPAPAAAGEEGGGGGYRAGAYPVPSAPPADNIYALPRVGGAPASARPPFMEPVRGTKPVVPVTGRRPESIAIPVLPMPTGRIVALSPAAAATPVPVASGGAGGGSAYVDDAAKVRAVLGELISLKGQHTAMKNRYDVLMDLPATNAVSLPEYLQYYVLDREYYELLSSVFDLNKVVGELPATAFTEGRVEQAAIITDLHDWYSIVRQERSQLDVKREEVAQVVPAVVEKAAATDEVVFSYPPLPPALAAVRRPASAFEVAAPWAPAAVAYPAPAAAASGGAGGGARAIPATRAEDASMAAIFAAAVREVNATGDPLVGGAYAAPVAAPAAIAFVPAAMATAVTPPAAVAASGGAGSDAGYDDPSLAIRAAQKSTASLAARHMAMKIKYDALMGKRDVPSVDECKELSDQYGELITELGGLINVVSALPVERDSVDALRKASALGTLQGNFSAATAERGKLVPKLVEAQRAQGVVDRAIAGLQTTGFFPAE